MFKVKFTLLGMAIERIPCNDSDYHSVSHSDRLSIFWILFIDFFFSLVALVMTMKHWCD